MAEVVRLLSNSNPFLTKKVEAAEVIDLGMSGLFRNCIRGAAR